MKTILHFAILFPAFSTAICFAADPQLPTIPDKTFKITNYGAIADDKSDIAPAIQSAIKAATEAQGGTVEIPAGTYISSPITLANNIRLQLDKGATLKMLPLDKYPGSTKNPQSFITGNQLHDVSISGEGTIEGQGKPWWKLARDPGVRRPVMIRLSSCQRVLIENLTLQNSPMFHIAMSGRDTQEITVRKVTIRANPSTDPSDPGHNTDACDVSGKHVLIEDCDVSVGDDNFTCGGGTSDVLIRRCTYGYGHGVSIGSPTRGEISNITVEDCTFTNTECGIRIKTDRDRGGNVHNLTYRNLKMTNVGIPILIYCAYNAKDKYRKLNDLTPEIAATYPAAPISSTTPFFHDITFSNITATVQPNNRAGLIWGLPESPVINVLIENTTITADKPFGIFDAKKVQLINCKIKTPANIKPLSTTNADITNHP